MASESIISRKKPGFPEVSHDESGTKTTISYIGLKSTIEPALPDVGAKWGDYQGTVKSVKITPTEQSSYVEATVTLELSKDNGEATTGDLAGVSFEIRWVNVERSMYEHPRFAIGGGGANELTTQDIFDIEAWQLTSNTRELRENYAYKKDETESVELSDNAKYFARGVELGQGTWTDKAPIAIKISEYVNGPPASTDAGEKQDPVGVPNIPTGYEWRKESADSVRESGETRWNLVEEWVGAKKVLVDKNNVYWAAP